MILWVVVNDALVDFIDASLQYHADNNNERLGEENRAPEGDAGIFQGRNQEHLHLVNRQPADLPSNTDALHLLHSPVRGLQNTHHDPPLIYRD